MHCSNTRSVATLTLTALLAACGGGGGGGSDDPAPPPPPAQVSGIFVDAAVEGLRWESNALSGTTDAAGTYQYLEGDPVSFYVGDILLGQSTGFSVIIPVDIVAGANSIDDPAVLNIARFLLTLDEDSPNWANGIKITQMVSDLAAGETINFAQSTDAFAADGNVQTVIATLTGVTSSTDKSLVSAADAREHLRLTIAELLAGSYSGTYSGDGEGTWSGTVNLNGDFTGTAISSLGGEPIQMFQAGAVSGDGSGKAGFGASGGALGNRTISFEGIFRTDGQASGTWKDDDLADKGEWSGSKSN